MKQIKFILKRVHAVMCSVVGLSKIRQNRALKHGPLVRVLAFHDIPNREVFESLLIFLKSEYHIITPEQFEAKEYQEEKINVLLTFDDGYETWFSNVKPVFERLNIKGIFFVCAGFVDAGLRDNAHTFLHDNLLLKKHRNPLTNVQIKDLQEVGTVGAHTFSHKALSSYKKTELVDDLEKEKDFLLTKCNLTTKHIAYPFGRSEDISETSLEVVKEAGYKYGYTTKRSFVLSENQLEIPRTMIDPDMPRWFIRASINGCYD